MLDGVDRTAGLCAVYCYTRLSADGGVTPSIIPYSAGISYSRRSRNISSHGVRVVCYVRLSVLTGAGSAVLPQAPSHPPSLMRAQCVCPRAC